MFITCGKFLRMPSSIQASLSSNEMLHIQVNDPKLMSETIEYRILDTSSFIVRRGKFSGFETQINLRHLDQKKYNLQLIAEESTLYETEFYKNAMI